MNTLPQLSDTEFRRVQRIVYETAGIAIADTSRTLLSSRVRRRLKALHLASFREYLKQLSSDVTGVELDALVDAVSTNETSFFRTAAHFQWFTEHYLQERIEGQGRFGDCGDLRIWSAACSSGEEAYSLAIILHQHQIRLTKFNVRVYGSDISQSAIDRAVQGVFSRPHIEKLDPSLQRYFAPCGPDQLRVRDLIRKHVEFSVHNLMQPSPYQELDCVFLRNVLIYFDRESKDRVMQHAIASLRIGGYLVLGPSEGVFDIPPGLRRVQSFLFQRC
jgi:chemotaxis protein methyltransferase CheR